MLDKELQVPPSAVQLRRMAKLIGAVFITCLASVAPQLVQAQAPRSPTPESVKGVVDFQTVAKGLEHPWSLAFLPDGRMLVTERSGRLRIVSSDGRVSEPVTGVPRVYAAVKAGCWTWR